MENLEKFFQQVITVHYNGDTYEFKVPSVSDKVNIASSAAKLRRDGDPDGIGVAYGYDPMSLLYIQKLATFKVLIKAGPPWIFSPDKDKKPVVDIEKLPDDFPIEEVMDQFDKELELFRASWNKSGSSTD